MANTTLRQIDVHMPDGVCDARLAAPSADGKYPGVLFFMDAFGLRPVTDRWIERIAGEGYVVFAPNLFYRSMRTPIVDDVPAATTPENRQATFGRMMPMMQLLTPENAARDSDNYVDYLTGLDQTGPGPIGVTGYCLGARMAIRAAAARPDRIGAVAGFHGGNLATTEPDSPHLLAPQVKAEVYFAYADNDQGATPEQVKRMDEALAAAGVTHRSEVYVDAPHGYTMSDTAAFREDAAERHFRELIELFQRLLRDIDAFEGYHYGTA